MPSRQGIPRILSEITPEEETGSRIGDFLARYRKLRRIFTELHPDCVLSFIGKNNIMTLLCTRFTGIPAVVSVRGEPKSEYYNSAMRFLAKTLFACAAGVIVQTRRGQGLFPARDPEEGGDPEKSAESGFRAGKKDGSARTGGSCRWDGWMPTKTMR